MNDAWVKRLLESFDFISYISRIDPKNVSALASRDVKRAYRFDMRLSGGKTVPLVLGLKEEFPYEVPVIAVHPPEGAGFLPHVSFDGFVCYVQPEGVVLDTDNPGGIIRDSILKSKQVLEDGIEGKNHRDFLEEFETYWGEVVYFQSPHFRPLSIMTYDPPPQDVAEVLIAYVPLRNVLVVASSHEKIKLMTDPLFYPSTLDCLPTLAIWLRLSEPIYPPRYGWMWSPNDFREIIWERLSDNVKAKILNIYRQRQKQKEELKSTPHRMKWEYTAIHSSIYERWAKDYLIFTFLTPSGKEATAAVEISPLANNSVLYKERCSAVEFLACNISCQILPLAVERVDHSYLVARTGGDLELTKKHVAILGCGSVGSHIALELVKTGISELTLVDFDEIREENVYRHVLGLNRVYTKHKRIKFMKRSKKIDSLKIELELKYPHVRVHTYFGSAEQFVSTRLNELQKYDLIVVAIGNSQTERYLNKMLHQYNAVPPVIFTWLEPYGIGGHALLTLNKGKPGCIQCLYSSRTDDVDYPYNFASFAAPGQDFGKTITGCAGAFTPYGSLDALQTAIIAVRLAISTLKGEEEDNPLISWKGDSKLFVQQGYELSRRYPETQEKLYALRYAYKDPKCPVCSPKESLT